MNHIEAGVYTLLVLLLFGWGLWAAARETRRGSESPHHWTRRERQIRWNTYRNTVPRRRPSAKPRTDQARAYRNLPDLHSGGVYLPGRQPEYVKRVRKTIEAAANRKRS